MQWPCSSRSTAPGRSGTSKGRGVPTTWFFWIATLPPMRPTAPRACIRTRRGRRWPGWIGSSTSGCGCLHPIGRGGAPGPPDPAGEAVAWVDRLEYQRLRLPAPDWQVLLAVPAELAGERARGRAQSEPGRARDSYERDDELQRRTGVVYAGLAAAGWRGRWQVVDADVDPGRLAA